MISAGSRGMAGAAILAARAALRAGSGLVRAAIPAELFPVVQVGVPEATCVERRLPIQNLSDFDAICIGPGLGETKESIDFVKELLISYEKTLIVDADGLNIIAHQNLFDLLRHRGKLYPERTILTPHLGEAKRLLTADPTAPVGQTPAVSNAALTATSVAPTATSVAPAALSSVQPTVGTNFAAIIDRQTPAVSNAVPTATSVTPAAPAAPTFDFSSTADAAERERIADALVRKTGAIIVLKGAGTLVAAEGRRTYTNTTGNPGMATGGSGDVLSGIITSLAGQRRQVGTNLATAAAALGTNLATDPTSATTPTEAIASTAPGAASSANATALGTSLANTLTGTAAGSNVEAGAAPEAEAAPHTQQVAETEAGKPRRIGAFEAALAGVYIHGLAGDLAAAELGEYGVTAGDLAHYTAYAIKKILSEV